MRLGRTEVALCASGHPDGLTLLPSLVGLFWFRSSDRYSSPGTVLGVGNADYVR